MKNVIYFLCFMILVTMPCCNCINDDHVATNKIERASLCESMLSQEDNTVNPEEVGQIPTEIDSVRIVLWHLRPMSFVVYPDTTGNAYPDVTRDGMDTVTLSREFCQLVLHAMDSMYLRRLPIVTSTRLDSVVTSRDHIPKFGISLYDRDKIYTKEIYYSLKFENRHFEFTTKFKQLADSAILLKDVYYEKKRRERENQ